MTGVLLWLAIPLVALIIGIVWAYLISRPARPAAMQDSMESFTRFRRALAEHPASAPRHPRRHVRLPYQSKAAKDLSADRSAARSK